MPARPTPKKIKKKKKEKKLLITRHKDGLKGEFEQ